MDDNILVLRGWTCSNGNLYSLVPFYVYWERGDAKVVLDGEFTVEELKGVADWMIDGARD